MLPDELDAAVVATDLDGVFELWRRAAARLHGWTVEATLHGS